MFSRVAMGVHVRSRVEGGSVVELHSEGESFRKALVFRGPDGSAATLIVLRRKRAVWITFSGAEKTSVTMSDAETDDLIDTLFAALGIPDRKDR